MSKIDTHSKTHILYYPVALGSIELSLASHIAYLRDRHKHHSNYRGHLIGVIGEMAASKYLMDIYPNIHISPNLELYGDQGDMGRPDLVYTHISTGIYPTPYHIRTTTYTHRPYLRYSIYETISPTGIYMLMSISPELVSDYPMRQEPERPPVAPYTGIYATYHGHMLGKDMAAHSTPLPGYPTIYYVRAEDLDYLTPRHPML